MLNDDQFKQLIENIFKLLSENKASPEDGMEVAQEILLASVERYAKEHGTTPEMIGKQIAMLGQPQKQYNGMSGLFANRGWIGNSGGLKEDN